MSVEKGVVNSGSNSFNNPKVSYNSLAKELTSKIAFKRNVMSTNIAPKKLFKKYLETEGWKNITIKSWSFILSIVVLLILIICLSFENIIGISFSSMLLTFFEKFYTTGFIGAISIMMIIIAGFAIMISIMQQEFLYAIKITGVLDVFYFVFFWDVLWAGITSLLWLAFGFLITLNQIPLQLLFGIIALLSTIYTICFTISMVLSITKLTDLKTEYTESILKIKTSKFSKK